MTATPRPSRPSAPPRGPRSPAAPLCALALLGAGCSAWRPAAVYEGWTLYEVPGEGLAIGAYEAAFEPAFEAVESRLGRFEERVRVHAWHGSVRVGENGRSRVQDGTDAGVHQVPGIGPARIQAYHSRRGAGPFGPSGVFIGVPDTGTAVHELVHARFAELRTDLPLWFEEGVAMVLGDGALVEGRWVVDGLACWPLRELQEQGITDAELARLLALSASDETPVRDNVLVHFVGWTVVFDLYRETGSIDWRRWLAAFGPGDPLQEVRRRMARTLDPAMPAVWLERLADSDPALRFATAKGVWKLRSRDALEALLVALEVETEDEVRAALAINTLAAASELELSWRRWRRVEQAVRRALRATELEDPAEQRALVDLGGTARRGRDRERAQDALQQLARFWEE